MFVKGPARTYVREEVPEAFHEVGIHKGYRHPSSTALECIQSAFYLHNETMNVWTHLVAAAVVICWAIRFHLTTGDLLTDSHYWPLLLLYVSSVTYLGGSALAHLFNTTSLTSRHLSFCFDYAFISLYSYASICAFRAYSYSPGYRQGFYYEYAQTIAVSYNLFSCLAKCQSRLCESKLAAKVNKVGTTCVSYALAMGPVLIRMHSQGWYSVPHWPEALRHHGYSLLSAIAAVLVYSMHMPEVLRPGRFDVFGHSHQIFHVFITLMTTEQIRGIILDIAAESHHAQFTAFETLGVFSCMAVALLTIMYVYKGRIEQHLKAKTN